MKINLKQLQETINHDATVIYESLNTDEAKKLYNLVIGLYEEVSSFQKEAPTQALNALSPHLQQVYDMLENILKEPLNYVSSKEEEISDEEEVVASVSTEKAPTEKPAEEPSEEPSDEEFEIED